MSNDATRTSRLENKKVELILQKLNTIPTLPAIAVRLMELTVSDHAGGDDLIRLIEADPSLSGKIIALASSADTGQRRRHMSVARAVVMLGFDAIRNAVLSIKVIETLKNDADAGA